MAYNHGVNVSEKPTSILPPVSVSAGVPFIVGTAPVNMGDVSNVNKPVLCSSYAEAVAAFGYVPPVADATGLKKYEYTISEFIYSQFALFGASPVIIVNVLDPATHKKAATATSVTLDAVEGSATIKESGIIKGSVSLGSGGGSEAVKAHGQCEVPTTASLAVEAKTAGEDGNKYVVVLTRASAETGVTVEIWHGTYDDSDSFVGDGTLAFADPPENISGTDLNEIPLTGHSETDVGKVSDYVTFDGTILWGDLPNPADLKLIFYFSGGSDAVVGPAYVEGTDYEAAFDDDGYLVITSLKNTDGTYKVPTGSAVAFSALKLDPSAVTANNVIGGVDAQGNKSGFELVDECFPRFRIVPGVLLAPGFSNNATCAAIMAAKAASINQEFSAISLIDAPTETVKLYSAVPEWKNNNNVVDPLQVVCWPLVALDGVVFHLSTQLAGVIAITDSENDDVPYVSPSNHNINATSTVLADGSEVWIAPDTGGYLNGQGIVTALNFIGGWKAWGNRTACYPGNTDVKDSYIPVKRMFSWIGNTLIQTFWSQVDAPLNRRLIDTIVDSANLWLNGLAARQYIIGGRVEFLESENPAQDLLDGIARFHVYVTPASPAREIDFILEYDPAYLENLFA